MRTEIRHEPDRSRYELLVDGEPVGVCDYRTEGERVVLPHTVIDPALRGRGLGAVLVAAALDDIRGTGRTVVPTCWFVADFIAEHPEYHDLRA
ncbi:MAG TPA: GNAT family N-acetyltransferase [Acidimicrobiales bacterium]|nr:GNAT family N-acetyltransferase [Acidimicrobiales bacterium]